jgi:hypothetical protein
MTVYTKFFIYSTFLGIASSPSCIREPEGNGYFTISIRFVSTKPLLMKW